MKTTEFRAILLEWYKTHKRDLPWRKTTDPYKILVSEVMLQQTQVDRVIPKYQAFLKEFPSAQELAKAPPAKVLRLWSGLGYNRRAMNLLAAARELSTSIDRGALPDTVEAWRALPGIGQYTASAVMAFAENKPVTVIDTNIRRIFFRMFIGKPKKSWEDTIKEIASRLVPEGKSRDWHNALMDFGATVCMAKPRCDICPFRKQCTAVTKYRQTPEQLETIARKTFKTTQTPFKGSNRYYRGQIITMLRQQEKQALFKLGKKIKSDFSKKDMPWLRGIVQQLKKEGLVVVKGKEIMLP